MKFFFTVIAFVILSSLSTVSAKGYKHHFSPASNKKYDSLTRDNGVVTIVKPKVKHWSGGYHYVRYPKWGSQTLLNYMCQFFVGEEYIFRYKGLDYSSKVIEVVTSKDEDKFYDIKSRELIDALESYQTEFTTYKAITRLVCIVDKQKKAMLDQIKSIESLKPISHFKGINVDRVKLSKALFEDKGDGEGGAIIFKNPYVEVTGKKYYFLPSSSAKAICGLIGYYETSNSKKGKLKGYARLVKLDDYGVIEKGKSVTVYNKKTYNTEYLSEVSCWDEIQSPNNSEEINEF